MESILTSVKDDLGIAEEYTHFDSQIIRHINSVFMILNQIGVGPPEGFYIEDELTTWTEFIENVGELELVKFLRVRLLFDPPLGGTVMESMNNQIREFEFRLNVAADRYGGIQNGV